MDHSHGVKDAKDQEEDEGDAKKKLFDLTQFAIGKKSVKYTVKVSARVFWVLLCYFHVLEGAILLLSGTFRHFWVS